MSRMSDDWYRDQAKLQQDDGELEIDDDAKVCRGVMTLGRMSKLGFGFTIQKKKKDQDAET